jgi:hypothetical protein
MSGWASRQSAPLDAGDAQALAPRHAAAGQRDLVPAPQLPRRNPGRHRDTRIPIGPQVPVDAEVLRRVLAGLHRLPNS